MTEQKRRFDPTYLLDLFAVLCFAAGPVLLALELLDLSRPLTVCCALIGLQLLFLALITRRWWILPALLALAGAAFGIAVWVLKLSVVLPWLEGLWAWLLGGLYSGSSYDPLTLPVLWLITLPLTALFYLLIRRLFHILPLLALGVLTNGAIYLMEAADWQGVLLLSLAGLILCLPRAAQRRQDPLPRKYGQLLALGLAVLCLTGAFFIVPMQDGVWRAEPLRILFSDVQDWYNDAFGTGAGGSAPMRSELLPLGDRLGGDLDRSAEMTLRVDSNHEVLFAGRYDDTYNGKQWYHGWQNGRFRWNSLFWRSRRSDAFQHKLPVGGHAAQELYDNMTRIVDVEVIGLTTEITLFAPASVQYLKFTNKDNLYPYFNRAGELFADRYFPSGTKYVARSVQLCRDMKHFDNNMHSLMEITAQYEDPYMEEIRARCTWLPADLPPLIAELTAEITDGARDDYDAMCRIESWLTDHCTYNETPGAPPKGEDFVTHFLTTREGYCTYYASAMAVMARQYGLPSRYVTGYGLVRESGSTHHYVARELSSHAWAEVYFHGIGWVTFDPLNWDADALSEEEFQVVSSMGVSAPTPTPTPTPAPTPAFDGEIPEASVSRVRDYRRLVRLLLWLLGAALLFALLKICITKLYSRKDRQFASDRLLRRLGRSKAGLCYFEDLEQQMRLYNLSRDDGETLRLWAERIDRALPLDEASCAAVISIYERMLYGNGAPFDEELRALEAYHAAVECALRDSLRRSYLWRRAIR